MAIRNDFAPGEVLAAADLNDTFGSKLPYSFGTATPTTTENGFLWYDSTGAPSKPTPKFWDGSAFVPLGGKILQIVRATDSTARTTTSTTSVDASISVTITPQKSDSIILLIWVFMTFRSTAGEYGNFEITDNSNNLLSGAERAQSGSGAISFASLLTMIGYSTPATTSATTYKGRFYSNNATTVAIGNNNNTGQLYAIEVSA
jgi:hypothetical protein